MSVKELEEIIKDSRDFNIKSFSEMNGISDYAKQVQRLSKIMYENLCNDLMTDLIESKQKVEDLVVESLDPKYFENNDKIEFSEKLLNSVFEFNIKRLNAKDLVKIYKSLFPNEE